MNTGILILEIVGGIVVGSWIVSVLLGVRYIPHDKVGIVEKLWSRTGSLGEGRIVALDDKAGFQSGVLRGGFHGGYFLWQYRVHRVPLVMVPEGQVAYVYARDGHPLEPTQTLGRVVDGNCFQDAVAFLVKGGQRGRQRAILREGLYAINLALFVVLTADRTYGGPIRDREDGKFDDWRKELAKLDGFRPVLIGQGGTEVAPGGDTTFGGDSTVSASDTIGVVTVQDGPPLAPGEIIAPEVQAKEGQRDHSYFQDPEAFLALGGRRGMQLQVLTNGTFFINRWFASVQTKPKTVIPIGFVGVVVSYHGGPGEDVTGLSFRYGEQVEPGHRGVWKRALPPGKYPLNPYALKVELVPTVNFVLRWITGQVEAHRYDADLESIELITADGYEPVLPLSLVLHIDYEKAPSVIQRFGDVKRLISQTLDPILSSYFRDVAQSTNMLELLTHREEIQARATSELGRRFQAYDINCIAVLIGRPQSKEVNGEDPIEKLFEQLRQRRLAEEQIQTFARQQDAAAKLRELNDARAAAEKQTELTQTRIDVEVAGNRGEAHLAEARSLAKRDVTRAEGESKSRELIGRGEASKIASIGMSEAAVFLQKIQAFRDPRLFALSSLGDQMTKSTQPLVPERLAMLGGGENGNGGMDAGGLFGRLIAMMLAERAGVDIGEKGGSSDELRAYAEDLMKKSTAQSD
ncbi:MAG: hypothetical protein HYR85_24725 [Planctomycetes bacterium]|nr:hypothetical protein [Planctomycetota bacterium]MBI3846713.1 hypothetical protein [Planctomycetota bacterium]